MVVHIATVLQHQLAALQEEIQGTQAQQRAIRLQVVGEPQVRHRGIHQPQAVTKLVLLQPQFNQQGRQEHLLTYNHILRFTDIEELLKERRNQYGKPSTYYIEYRRI